MQVLVYAIVNVFLLGMPIKQHFFPPHGEDAIRFTYRGITLSFGLAMLGLALLWIVSGQSPLMYSIMHLAFLGFANLAAYGLIVAVQRLRRDESFVGYE
jgi:hypothetical protein